MLRLLTTSVVAMTPVVLPTCAAQARAAGPAPTRLVLKAAVGSAIPHSVTLRCYPAGGTHPKATQACSDLTRSHGAFSVTTRDKSPRACFMIYSPITVSAAGTWEGRRVRFRSKFPNTCVLRSRTGSIFDF